MNETSLTREDGALVRQLVEVLRLREADAPSPERAATIAELTPAAESDDPSAPLPEIIEAVECSSLGTPGARELRLRTPPAVVADVLARAARIAARGTDFDGDPVAEAAARGAAVPVEGPLADWFREVQRLFENAGLDEDQVLHELGGMGFTLTTEELATTLTALPVCPDRELVRSIVTVLGEDWTGRGYEASYDAALDEQQRRRQVP